MAMKLNSDKIMKVSDAQKLIRKTKGEAEKALASGKDLSYVTDHYIIAIGWNTGLRLSEICSLSWGDVCSDSLIVRQGNGGKSRTVHFGEKTRSLFTKLRDFREDILKKPATADSAVFLGLRGRLTDSAIHRRFKFWIQRTGLNPALSFHSLRHGYATRLLDEGAQLPTVRDQLGHTNISTTSAYLHFTAKAKEVVCRIT